MTYLPLQFNERYLAACECCGCVYLFTAHGACTITGETFSFREVVCWLMVFFVIFDNICTSYLFQRNIFRKAVIDGVLNVSL